jgi:REP element-mobilizing transposase RayT
MMSGRTTAGKGESRGQRAGRATAKRRVGEQLALGLPPPKRKHGGTREGAGRPRSSRSGEAPHRTRPVHRKRHPVHVVLRATKDVPRLRTDRMFKAIRAALRVIGGGRTGFRVVHASIQRTHLHFLVEAEDKQALTCGVRALAIAMARRINAACGRRGKVFARYHATVVTSPRQMRNTLAYVLNNWRHHREDEGSLLARRAAIDPYATGYAFDGWREKLARPDFEPLPAVSPETWLLRIGWRSHPPISVHEVPKD